MPVPDRHPHIDLIQAHLECCLGSFLTGLYRKPAWFGAFSEAIQDRHWNFVIPLIADHERLNDQLEDLIRFYRTIDQHPSLYGEEDFLETVRPQLQTADLEQVHHDAWMELTDNRDTDERPDDIDITEVTTAAEKTTFLTIFDAAFGEDEPLPQSYLDGIKRALDEDWGAGYTYNFLLADDSEPVGIGTVAVNGEIALIYNIATHPDHQGQGFGTAATQEAIQAARQHADRIVLQAEADSFVQQFYSDLGFETAFTAKGYHGEGWTDP